VKPTTLDGVARNIFKVIIMFQVTDLCIQNVNSFFRVYRNFEKVIADKHVLLAQKDFELGQKDMELGQKDLEIADLKSQLLQHQNMVIQLLHINHSAFSWSQLFLKKLMKFATRSPCSYEVLKAGHVARHDDNNLY